MAGPMTTVEAPGGRERLLLQGMEGQLLPGRRSSPRRCCAFYAERLPTVEINNTFYRMPKASVLETLGRARRRTASVSRSRPRAASRTSRGSRRKRRPSRSDYLYRNLAALGAKRGPVLFQLPPNPEEGPAAPRAISCRLLPEDHRAAFEFRNESWFDDDVYAALKGAGAALCLSEREDNAPPPLVETAPWGYVRLRLETYSDDDLAQWAERLAATSWREIYVYFMHEPTAPAYAQALMRFGSHCAAKGGGYALSSARRRRQHPCLSHASAKAMSHAQPVTIASTTTQHVSGLLQVPADARACYVFAHGAGAGHGAPVHGSRRAGARRRAASRRCVTSFPYMERGSKRPDPPARRAGRRARRGGGGRAGLPGLPLFAGGKSFGGRMTSQAQAASPLPGVRGLVFLGFPLHPAGQAVRRARDAPVRGAGADAVPAGHARRARGLAARCNPLVERLGARATLALFDDADHSFHVPARTGRKDAEIRVEMADAMADWIRATGPS